MNIIPSASLLFGAADGARRPSGLPAEMISIIPGSSLLFGAADGA